MIDDVRTTGTGNTAPHPSFTQQLVSQLLDAERAQDQRAARAHLPILAQPAAPPAKAAFPAWHPAARTRTLAEDSAAGAPEPLDLRQYASRRLPELAHVELVVSPFATFREVGRFQQALASLPDVSNVQVRHLHRGTLQVRVQCQGTARLLHALADAYAHPFDVLSREPHRIEIVLA